MDGETMCGVLRLYHLNVCVVMLFLVFQPMCKESG